MNDERLGTNEPMSGLNPDAMNEERKGSAEYRREQDKERSGMASRAKKEELLT